MDSVYDSATNNFDLSILFLEKGLGLLKENGELGFIITNKFVQGDYGEGIRKKISGKKCIRTLIDFGDQQVFEDATTYTCMVFLKNNEVKTTKYCQIKEIKKMQDVLNEFKTTKELESDIASIRMIDTSELNESPWIFLDDFEKKMFNKIKSMKKLYQIAKIFVGLQTSADPIYIVKGTEKGNQLEIQSNHKKFLVEKEVFRPILTGKNVKRWKYDQTGKWLLFPYYIESDKAHIITKKVMMGKFPKTWKYLMENKTRLEERDKGSMKGKENWHAYVYEKNLTMFDKEKIMTGVLAKRTNFSLDSDGIQYFVGGGNAGVYGIKINTDEQISPYYLLGLLNSTLLDWFVKKKSSRFHSGYYSFAKRFIDWLPIKIPDSEYETHLSLEIENLVKQVISNNQDIRTVDDTNKVLSLESEIIKLEKEIDKKVFQIYGIDDGEKEIMNKRIKP